MKDKDGTRAPTLLERIAQLEVELCKAQEVGGEEIKDIKARLDMLQNVKKIR